MIVEPQIRYIIHTQFLDQLGSCIVEVVLSLAVATRHASKCLGLASPQDRNTLVENCASYVSLYETLLESVGTSIHGTLVIVDLAIWFLLTEGSM